MNRIERGEVDPSPLNQFVISEHDFESTAA
jgi:hypothetical protein